MGGSVTYEYNGKDKIHYTYDSSGKLISMNLNGAEYYYVRNAQGDIIGLINAQGEKVVSYTYDSWGKLISIEGSLKDTVGEKNPYRYRGYRYDSETGLYYLQNRYYNPEWGRFINADGIIGETGELLGHNLFAYSKNNWANMSDYSGFRPVYTLGEETEAMRAASYAVMNRTRANRARVYTKTRRSTSIKRNSRVNSRKKYDVKGAGDSLTTSTLFGIAESVGAEATLGHVTLPYGKMPIPVKLSTFANVENFFKTASIVSLCFSVQENFSGKYGKVEACLRTGVDIACFAGVNAFCACGGWTAVGIGLGIGVLGEGIKILINEFSN